MLGLHVLSFSAVIDHICIDLLVPSVLEINIGGLGGRVDYWGGLTPPIICLATWISGVGFLCTWEPAN